jgi:hypothetical protein
MRSRAGHIQTQKPVHKHSIRHIELYARVEELRIRHEQRKFESLAWICLHAHQSADFSKAFSRIQEMFIDLRSYIPYLVEEQNQEKPEDKDARLIRMYEAYLASLEKNDNAREAK